MKTIKHQGKVIAILATFLATSLASLAGDKKAVAAGSEDKIPTEPKNEVTEQEQAHKVIAETGGARSLDAILEKDREVHIRINQYTHLYLSADGKYTYSTGPNGFSGISSHGTWKASGRFILMTGDWQPVNAASTLVTKSLKAYIGLLRRDPQFPEFYEGWFYFDEINPVGTERNAEQDGGGQPATRAEPK